MERDFHRGKPDELPDFLEIDPFLEWEDLRIRALSRTNPLPWRTLIIGARSVMGVQDPDHTPVPPEKFEETLEVVSTLVGGTYYQELKPEIMYGVGGPEFIEKLDCPPLDFMIFNTRKDGEPFLPALSEELIRREKRIVALQTVGDRFGDNQMRILGPRELMRPVDHMIIMTSTQEMYGGEMYPLLMGTRLLRNEKYKDTNKADIIIPMFGGSRGDKDTGQDELVGYEILEAVVNPKLLAMPVDDILTQLRKEYGGQGHKVIRIISIDIHGQVYPDKVFREAGFEFINVSPQALFADALMDDLKKHKLNNLPPLIVVCDNGDVNRMQDCAAHVLYHPSNKSRSVELLNIEKHRNKANEIVSIEIVGLQRWRLDEDDRVVTQNLPIPTQDLPNENLRAGYFGDDMIDRGGTMKGDVRLVHSVYPNMQRTIVGATHAVFSKGVDHALNNIPADQFLIGNTLNPDGLNRHDVEIVDCAPAVADAIFS